MSLRAPLVVLLLALAAVTVTPSAAADEECTPEKSEVQLCMGERACYPDPCIYHRYCVVRDGSPLACVWWPF